MIRTLLTTLLLTLGVPAHDPVINPAVEAPTVLHMFVERGQIRAELEIEKESLFAFRNLLPDAIYAELKADLGFEERRHEERLQRFFERDLVLALDGGAPLVGKVQQVKWGKKTLRDLLSTEVLAADNQKGPRAVHASILYRVEDEAARLSICPPSRVASVRSPLTKIGFRLYHLEVPVADYRMLGQTELVSLDWKDPWFSKFDNPEFFRFNRDLLQVFVYVEALEVRAEVVFRPRDLQEFVDLGLTDRERIPVALQKEIRGKLEIFLSKHLRLTIDGEVQQPSLASLNFLQLKIGNTEILDGVGETRTADTFLGAVFVVSRMGWPDKVGLSWDLYPERVPIATAIAVDLENGFPVELSKSSPKLTWYNNLEDPPVPAFLDVPVPPAPAKIGIPVLSLGLVFAGLVSLVLLLRSKGPVWGLVLLSTLVTAFLLRSTAKLLIRDPFAPQVTLEDAEASLILEASLGNIYHAYDRREENLVYDGLARTVDGPLLKSLYLQMRKSLELANQGGVLAKVEQVQLDSAEIQALESGAGFDALCRWQISGSVGHWGHVHRRYNAYEAKLRLEDVGGSWKITALDVKSEKRL
jgi:hypothetical protein